MTTFSRDWHQLAKDILQIKDSGYFDEAWYLTQYQDLLKSQQHPIEHYLLYGADQHLNPSRHFNTAHYLLSYPDVARTNVNPLLHYLNHGLSESRTRLSYQQSDDSCSRQMTFSEDFLTYQPVSSVAFWVYGTDRLDWQRTEDLLESLSIPYHLYVVTRDADLKPRPRNATTVTALKVDTEATFCAALDNFLPDTVEIVIKLADSAAEEGYPNFSQLSASQLRHMIATFEHCADLQLLLPDKICNWSQQVLALRRSYLTALRHTKDATQTASSIWQFVSVYPQPRLAIWQQRNLDHDYGIELLPAQRAQELIEAGKRLGTSCREAFLQDYATVAQGFDARFYKRHNPEVAELRYDPVYHFLMSGRSATDPHPEFSSQGYLLLNPDVPETCHPYLHYLQNKAQQTVLPSQYAYAEIINLIREAGIFDEDYYLDCNEDVALANIEPLYHYCQQGWHELRNPSPHFDTWWYSVRHLGSCYKINPLLHYAVLGKQQNLSTRPPEGVQNRCATGFSFTKEAASVRRICLFAGYDKDNIVDDYVIDYLKELSHYADIYYLADCDMPEQELDKLRPYVNQAWAQRHATYDFGSYALLANTYIGWDIIEEYDELILANDSCYLIDSLKPVFSKMQASQCDFWALQATKGIAATRQQASNQFTQKIPLETVKRQMLSAFEHDACYDFLLGSYFICYRRPVIRDQGFRHLLNSVSKEVSKKIIIQKYEIGITRYLINAGHEFSTFMEHLYPFHPVFSKQYFEMVKAGFPLLKRFFLSENHYHVPELHTWKQRLLAANPTVDTRRIEAHLQRTTSPQVLYNKHHLDVAGRPPQLLSDEVMQALDESSEKHPDWWVFPVCGYTHSFSGNERAVFEAVKDNPQIKKIILTRDKHIQLTGSNVVSFPLRSLEAQHALIQSKVVFIRHTLSRNIGYPLSGKHHLIINLWHGIPLKRIGSASLNMQDRLALVEAENARLSAVIASSKIDRLAMASAFSPLRYRDIWVTGLPRNDFILSDYGRLPEDFQLQSQKLKALLGGKKLILFAPTFKDDQKDAYYQFSWQEKYQLKTLLQQYGCVLGVREHMADTSHSYFGSLEDIGALNMAEPQFPNVEVIYRQAHCLITDYSSSFVDFLQTNRPLISFAYDHERYTTSERGLFYDMKQVFPGPICHNFADVIVALEQSLSQARVPSAHYQFVKDLFFDYMDDQNSQRLVRRVMQTLELDMPEAAIQEVSYA